MSDMLQSPTFRQSIANCFAKRPRLREVLSREGYDLLVDHYPWIRHNHPQLSSLDLFVVLSPAEDGNSPGQRQLIDVLLAHFLARTPMQLKETDQLSIAPPQVFRAQESADDSASKPEINLDMARLNSVFDDLLSTLVEAFQQAQVSFWSGYDDDSQVPRLRWVEQTIKAALSVNVQRQGLRDDEKSVLYEMLAGTTDGLSINTLQITLENDGNTFHPPLPTLLLTATRGIANRVLACKSSGVICSYKDLPAFSAALQAELADRYRFRTLHWARSPAGESPFALQATEILNVILDDIRRLRVTGLPSVTELEANFARVSDPSPHFLDQACQVDGLPSIKLPGWLVNAKPGERFDYHAALLDLAASQGQFKGTTSLGDIDSISRYASRRLREQLQMAHQGKATCNPDALLISISERLEGSSPTAPQSLFLRDETLTELAISRLGSNEVATRISNADGTPYQAGLTLEDIESLILKADIGGSYPKYVNDMVNAQPRRAARISQFAREWRSQLRFSTLKAGCEGQLDEATRKALLDACSNADDNAPGPRFAPLAFLCAPGATTADRAHGMYLIDLPERTGWLLYRPFYENNTLLQFATLETLMAALRSKGELQQSVLDWLGNDVRAVYENDGFIRPHLHPGLSNIAHLLGVDSALVDTVLDKLKQPVTITFAAWDDDLDRHLFDARVQAMLQAASTNSVSNAQEKWALVKQAAWALFNTLTLFWHGPLASLVWLVLAVSAAKDDVSALLKGADEDRILAVTDLLTNLAMLLAHGATHAPAPTVEPLAPPRFAQPPERLFNEAPSSAPPTERDWAAPDASTRPGYAYASSWRNNQRLGNLSTERRQALVRLQARQSLAGLTPLSEGRLRGLYEVAQRYYVKLDEAVFEVQETWGGVQVIGPDQSQDEWVSQWQGSADGYHIVGRERSKGPWLTRWNGEWSLDLSLAGGMPRNRQAITAENRQAFDQMRTSTLANQQELAKLEPLLEKAQKRLKPYDELAKAFTDAFKALPADARSSLPATLQQQRQQLLDLRKTQLPHLRLASLYLEKQGVFLHANAALFKQMLEPRFLKFDRGNVIQRRLNDWTETCIDNDMLLMRRLLELPDHERLKELAQGLRKQPVDEVQIRNYIVFREATRDALAVSRRLLKTSERLDKTLAAALDNSQVDFQKKKAKIDKAIKTRPYSTLIIRAQMLSDLAYLTLDKTLLSAESAAELLPLQGALSDNALSTTFWTHDGLAAANLPVEQQAEVLNNALRDYRRTLGKAHYLQSFDEVAIDSPVLAEFTQAMDTLIDLTETELDGVVKSIESGVASPPRPVTHRVKAGKRTLIRTSKGHSVLVEREQEDNLAVQLNPITEQPAGRYELREGVWYEIPAQNAQPGVPDRAEQRYRAKRLLERKDERIRLAKLYTNEPNSLRDLLDWQTQDMREVSEQLATSDTPKDINLASQLDLAILTITAEKQRLLTEAYLKTRHPDGEALRYLNEQKRLQISRTTTRKALSKPGDYLDVYQIRDTEAAQTVLWEAHFHYRSAEAPARDFAKGHLKFWEPRGKDREARMEEASSAAERLQVYRGDLRLEQVDGVIPFPDQ
ncbi:hypothetical protein BGP84_04825 [Pseudomonas putida]|uniref:Uncharacterized protein n=1 Tax=Pseudomonas putida TaxID=303 RepID=A0A2S3XAI4_PSEPU|nr:DUF6543 domain-containing protein [Pseudomonas putida]POG01949.1 hypothetical protein BGP85_26080 [Pseudomonas putida]POG12615.1 hypothetical protein BGP84_04825 [Pseudomonas putida]